MVGEIGGVAEAEAVNGLAAVQDRNGLERQSTDIERRAIEQRALQLRNVGDSLAFFADVAEAAPDSVHGLAARRRWESRRLCRKLKGRTSSRPIMWSACE